VLRLGAEGLRLQEGGHRVRLGGEERLQRFGAHRMQRQRRIRVVQQGQIGFVHGMLAASVREPRA
jgi:hypothetical protein